VVESARRAASQIGNPELRAAASDREHRKVYGDVPHLADSPDAARRGQRGHLRAVDDDTATDDDAALLEPIPAYPVDALTGPLRDFVEWAIRDGLTPAAAGAAGLAALATVTGRAELALTSTFTVRPTLWICPVGGTGTGKSPALDQAFATITALYDAERSQWDDEAEALEGDKSATLPPKPQPIVLGDVTLPSVARWLSKNGGTGSLVYDELMTMLSAMMPVDRAKLCEAWTARRPMHIQRVGDGGGKNAVDIYVGKPVLSMVGPLTPDNTKELGREGDGFRARWLVHLIDGTSALLDGGPQPVEWSTAITALYESRSRARRWSLTGRARTEYERACQRWKLAQDEALPQSVIEALRKADQQCARIALVLAESCDHNHKQYRDEARGSIPLKVVKSAIALTDYVMECWRALPGAATLNLSIADEKLSGAANELLTWLESRPKGTEGLPDGCEPRARATRREIQQAKVGGAAKAQLITQMILEYEAQYPGCVVRFKTGGPGPERVYVYFPQRRTRTTVDSTVLGTQAYGETTDEVAGHGLASDETTVGNQLLNGCVQQLVSNSSPGVVVDAGAVVVDLGAAVVDEADGWPADSYGSDHE
jgi:hypothetical protein